MIKLNNKNANIIAFVVTLSVTLSILFFIQNSKEEQTDLLKQIVINEAKQSFMDIVTMRNWNSKHGGVYVKQTGDLKPNPFLLENKTTTVDGTELIKINHAWMTKQISQIHDEKNNMTFKITSLKPLNPENAPNKLEEKALNYFEENKNSLYYYNTDTIFTKKEFDFIGKLLVQESCMQCHAIQGYKVGEIRGGIRVTLDTTSYQDILKYIQNKHFYLDLLVLFLAISFFTIVYKLNQIIFKQKDKLEQLNQSLEEKVVQRTKELKDLNESLEARIQEAIEKNKEQEELMIAQSRHAAMGEMISMIAHQWRQPISAISMGANNMLADIQFEDIDPKVFEELSNDIIDQTKYLTKTIDDFRDFFKPTKERVSVYPAEIIEESLAIISKSIENSNITLTKKIDQTSEIQTYSRELLQVLINILKNAKEAFEKSPTDNKTIAIELHEDDDNIYIIISDNAGGIPEDIRNKIFDPYFSTKKEKNGTGLGLYMSKTIIDKHLYGKISVENLHGGAQFTLTLPKG